MALIWSKTLKWSLWFLIYHTNSVFSDRMHVDPNQIVLKEVAPMIGHDTHFLARLFSKKTSRYCHSPGVVGGGIVVVRRRAKTLTFSNITEDIYLKLRKIVHYQKGNLYQ